MESKAQKRIREEMLEEYQFDFPVISLDPINKEVKEDILKTGLGIIGNGGTGKTTATYTIANTFLKDPHVQVKIVDKAQNFVHDFSEIMYDEMDIYTIKDKGFYYGAEDFLYNANVRDSAILRDAIAEMIDFDYELRWRYKSEGLLNNWTVWVVEEVQDILANVGTKSRWNTYVSSGRNFNMSFIFIGRRMAQLSAKIRENMGGFLFSRTTGGVDLNRVRKLTNKTVAETLPHLEWGQFIYWNGNEAKFIQETPAFKAEGSPRRWSE